MVDQGDDVYLTVLPNALAEAFFATLETELLMRHRFATRTAARVALFDFIEGFYNSHRRHSALGYFSPAEFERPWWQRTEVGGDHDREPLLSEASG